MLFTNTNTTYLIFLAYLIFTEFEQISMFVAEGHALRAFFLWRLVNKRILRGRIRKDSPLFPFFSFIFSFFFFGWTLGWSGHLLHWGGGIPNTGIQWEVTNYGWNLPALLFYITSENLNIQIAVCLFKLDYGIYHFMEDIFKNYIASYRIGTYIYILIA